MDSHATQHEVAAFCAGLHGDTYPQTRTIKIVPEPPPPACSPSVLSVEGMSAATGVRRVKEALDGRRAAQAEALVAQGEAVLVSKLNRAQRRRAAKRTGR